MTVTWLDIILVAATGLVLCFAAVLLVGAPYIPTLPKQTAAALDYVARLQGKQLLFELGCGDGTVMLAAAKRGIPSVGIELNPIMWLIATVRLRRYRALATVRFGNFWKLDTSPATVIFVFLHPRFMGRLDNKITQEASKKVKLVSFAFAVPDKKPIRRIGGMFVYEYQPVVGRQ